MAEVDIGAVFQLLGEVARGVRDLQADMSALKKDVRLLQGDVRVLQSDMVVVKRDIASLRQTVAEYHASVLGHGVLITELDERLRRVEQHLGLPSAA